MASILTFLAVFVSCLGLFGMASFSAEQRTREIGIRKVLGASIAKIMALISKDFMVLLAVSNVIAWPIAYLLMDKLLKNYAYRTHLSDTNCNSFEIKVDQGDTNCNSLGIKFSVTLIVTVPLFGKEGSGEISSLAF